MQATKQAERFRHLFDYDPWTGSLKWRNPTARNIKKGQPAGSKDRHGYRKLIADGKTLLVHRVIWCMCHGEMPKGLIDHVNGNRADNRIDNLRLATRSQNSVNSTRARGSTGVRGITRLKSGLYRTQIKSRGRVRYLGSYTEISEAREVFELAHQLVHGNFSPYSKRAPRRHTSQS